MSYVDIPKHVLLFSPPEQPDSRCRCSKLYSSLLLQLSFHVFFSFSPLPLYCSLPLLCADTLQLEVPHETVQCGTVQTTAGDCSAAGWMWRASHLSSTMLFVGSDGQTGNSRMIQCYRVRIYDNVPWETFPCNEHSTSYLEALFRNEDEDTKINWKRKNGRSRGNSRMREERMERKKREAVEENSGNDSNERKNLKGETK